MKAQQRATNITLLQDSIADLFDRARTQVGQLGLETMLFFTETDQHSQVKAFAKKFGLPLPDAPTFDGFRAQLRIDLIQEEFDELKYAIDQEDMVEFVDAICDLLYVVHGAALEAGIQHIQPFFEEVHFTNMAKEPDLKRGDGKIMKPKGWVPPNIAGILAERYPQTEPAVEEEA